MDAEEELRTKGTKDEMKAVFDRIDENGNGFLDADELRKLASIIDPQGLSSTELEEALSMMDEDGDAEVDFEEFFEWWGEINARTDGKMFAIFDSFRAAMTAEKEAAEAAKKPRRVVDRFDDKAGKLLMRTLRNEMSDMLKETGLDLEAAFKAFDVDGDGTVTPDEFRTGLRSLQLKLTAEQIEEVVDLIDKDGDGNLDYMEFVEQFEVQGVKGKSSALSRLIYAEEDRLGYHDGAETAEEIAAAQAAELKRMEDADEDYDTPGDGGGDDPEGGGDAAAGGGDSVEPAPLPPLTAYRIATSEMPMPMPASGCAPAAPRLFCVLPSPHARPRGPDPVERALLGGGFLDDDGWRGDTFQMHCLCEWGCGHWLDPAAGLPLTQPRKALLSLAPALRPNLHFLKETGLLEKCRFPMPSSAIAKELAEVMGVSALEIEGSLLGGAGLDLGEFSELVLDVAEKAGIPQDPRSEPISDDPGFVPPEEVIGTETWHGPLPDDPPPPPTLGGSFDGPGGVTAVQGRRLAEEESTRAAEALPSAARTFESMLGTHPAAVKSRRDYIRALEEFHRRLRLTDPLRQWAGLRKVTMDNGETCFLCNKHASMAAGKIDLSWQAAESSVTSAQLIAKTAWPFTSPPLRFRREGHIPSRMDPGPTVAEIEAAEREAHTRRMRAMAESEENARQPQPDHPIERWNLVVLAEGGPRYRGLAKGEIAEVLTSKYKGEYRVKCPNGKIAYFLEEELAYWDEGTENKQYDERVAKGVGFLEDQAIAAAGGVGAEKEEEEPDLPPPRGGMHPSASCALM